MFGQFWLSLTGLFDYIISILLTLPRDLRGLYKLIRHSIIIKYRVYRQQDFIAVFRENVKYYKSKDCFIFEETSLTFQQVCCNIK
jgi:hypothetical protein